MPDFDFDELDKAVAGALQPDGSADDASSAADVTPTPAEPSTPSESSKESEQAKDAPAERPVVPAARRSAGRFMDVVHPSSDMRGRTSSELLTRSATPATFTPPVSTPKEDAPSDTTSEVPSEAESTDWSQPLESPFLPDAKVEKRPLGAFATRESSIDTSSDEELKLEAPDDLRLEATTMPDPIDFAAQAAALDTETEDTGSLGTSVDSASDAPEEITVEEVIEARTETTEVTPEAEVQEEPAPTIEVEPEVETETHHDAVPTETAEPEVAVGPTSISQQYEEKPSTTQESGAIYDTESYHQPLPQSAKKHSGVWTIIWILLLVILGAGAGVAFYLFVLPML